MGTLQKFVMVGGYQAHKTITWDSIIEIVRIPYPDRDSATYHPADEGHLMTSYLHEVYTKRKITFAGLGKVEFFAIQSLDDHATFMLLLEHYAGKEVKHGETEES
jgi:hypothetical protein